MSARGGEDMRRPCPVKPRRRSADARCQVPSRFQCGSKVSIPSVHLADQKRAVQPQRLEHASHDLDFVTLGIDLHQIRLELRSLCEKIVERTRLDAREPLNRPGLVGRHKSCCR